MDEKKRYFSRREIILVCFLVLVSGLFIYCWVKYKWKLTDIIFQNSFTFVTSVACSILATALLPKIFQSPNSEEIQKIIQEELAIIRKNSFGTPSKVYMDTNDPNPEFNENLNKSILQSVNYIYFSDRAKYTAKRLYQGIDNKYTNPNLRITVFVADIRENAIFTARKDAYMNREKKLPSGILRRSLDQIISQEKMDILNSIYCLTQLLDEFNITIYLHKEIPFVRFEITDTMFVMTFLNRIAIGKKHPLTVVYENDSVFKPNYEEYVNELAERSHKLTEQELTLNGLIKLGNDAGLVCDEKSIKEYYNSLTKNEGNNSGT